MFYRIEPGLDEKVTGIDDVQASSAIYPINIWDPIYINQWGHTLIPDYVVLPIPKIKTKAKLTDLMSVYFTGSSYRLTISSRLKEILEKKNGLTDVLVKPFEYADLENVISRYI